MVKKIESASSAFIFRERPERLKLAELQNPVKKRWARLNLCRYEGRVLAAPAKPQNPPTSRK
jgi:hypothetical protein